MLSVISTAAWFAKLMLSRAWLQHVRPALITWIQESGLGFRFVAMWGGCASRFAHPAQSEIHASSSRALSTGQALALPNMQIIGKNRSHVAHPTFNYCALLALQCGLAAGFWIAVWGSGLDCIAALKAIEACSTAPNSRGAGYVGGDSRRPFCRPRD